MFFGRKKEIVRLNQENKTLRGQLAATETDPYVLLAQEIGAQVEGIISSGINVDTRIEDEIARRRAAMYLARIQALAELEISRSTAEEKAVIKAQALVGANKLAAAALQRFLQHEATAYREEVQAQLNRERPETIIREAKQQIVADERSQRVQAAKDQLLARIAEDTQREQLKARAQELRVVTKRTHVLDLAQLEDGDPLTITFTQPGQGREPLTMTDQYGGSGYRSHLEARKVSGHIIDKTIGIFEIDKDSWLRERSPVEQALRGGQQVQLSAHNPLLETTEQSPCIVKAAPLTIQTLGGLTISDNLDVWWVNLGDFKALS